jgi:alpha-1,2-mannosyltransferase
MLSAVIVKRRRILALAALLVVAMIAYVFKVSHRMSDFEVYAQAASRALAGESLYRPEDGHWLFKYLPAFAVVAIPIALVPLSIVKLLWFLATVFTVVLLLSMTIAILPARRRPVWILAVATVVVMGDFYAHEIRLGQTNLFLVTAVVAALLAMRRGRESLAGALVVVAVVLKPYAVLLLPWLVARRERRAVVAATVGMLVILLLPVARYGVEPGVRLHIDWWHTVTTSVDEALLNIDNISWLAMFSRWFGPGAVAQALTACTIVAALATTVYVFSLRRSVEFPELLEASLLLTLMPLMSPQGWEYTLLTATPAVMCLVNYSDRLPALLRVFTIAALAVIGLSIYDLMGRTAYTAFMEASGVTIAFVVVIAALVLLRRRQVV